MRKGEFSPGEVVPGTRYRVVGLLGVGGMGLVYEVEHLELGKHFVLKALLSDLAVRGDIVARLRNEQRALGRLQHPNIIAVTDAGVTSTNLPFFVMERLEGETLGTRLRRSGRLPVIEAIAIARGVLEGLSAAHEIGVVHRDIKPQNIFLSSGSRPKILDFGVAKVVDKASIITARGVAIGTPRYMSPEQVGGENVDGRSDLYAIGLLLFETIAGRGPFDDVRDANEMLVAHRGTPAPRLAGLAPGVTRELDAFVASLLAKKPSDRSPTARAAVAALAAIADRYGGGSNLEAPTPLASYSSTTQPLIVSGRASSAAATRPDGLAAREPPTIADTTRSHGTTEFLPDTAPIDRRGDGPRAPGGTLYDPSSRAVTVAQPNFVVPMDAMRTERLEPLGPAPFLDEPTHTRVPSTPSDGSPSLAPVRVSGPRSERGRPTALWLAGVALVVVLAGAYFVVRASAGSAPSDEPSAAAAPDKRLERASATPVSARAPTGVESPASAPPAPVASTVAAPTSAATAASLPRADAPNVEAPSPAPFRARSASSSVRAESAVPSKASAGGATPSAASAQRSAKAASSVPALPPGLPGSGL